MIKMAGLLMKISYAIILIAHHSHEIVVNHVIFCFVVGMTRQRGHSRNDDTPEGKKI